MKTIIWAHRGSSFIAPENTMEAFDLAVKQKADGIELDIHLTSDGKLAVFHDETLERTTNGTGFVENYTMNKLKQLNAAVLHPEYTGAKIPSLTEVLDYMRGNSLMLNIEIKEEHDTNPLLIKQLAMLIKDFKLEERTMYCSFNHYSLSALRNEIPYSCIGLLYFAGLVNPWAYAKSINADCLHPHFHYGLMNGQVENAHKFGLKVNTWTLDEPEDIKYALNQKADGIITNKPDLALRIRNS